jgi:hypothetical protein
MARTDAEQRDDALADDLVLACGFWTRCLTRLLSLKAVLRYSTVHGPVL